jgi:MT0933-like antitoxin protein
MGMLDTVKGWVSGNKGGAKQGVDTAADQAKKVVPDEHDAKVDQAADAAKDAIDKLDG